MNPTPDTRPDPDALLRLMHLEEEPRRKREKKLEDDPSHLRLMLTESGIGYRWSADLP